MKTNRKSIIIAVLITLFAPTSLTYTMDELIKLPKQHVLCQRLSAQGFNHFMQKTKIVQQLASQEKSSHDVINIVEKAIRTYNRTVQYPVIIHLTPLHRSQIITAILRDSPEIVDALIQAGLIEIK